MSTKAAFIGVLKQVVASTATKPAGQLSIAITDPAEPWIDPTLLTFPVSAGLAQELMAKWSDGNTRHFRIKMEMEFTGVP